MIISNTDNDTEVPRCAI